MDSTGGGLAFVAYYCRNDKVVAVCSLAKDPVVSHASELLRVGKMPSGKESKLCANSFAVANEKYQGPVRPKSAAPSQEKDLNWVLFIGLPALVFIASTIFFFRS